MTRRWGVLAIVFLGILTSYVDRGNLSIAAAPMMRDFAIPPSTMGILLSAFFWTYAACQIPAGLIVDRFGIKRVYAVAFLIWSLASASIALSRGVADVLVMRMILGMAEAAGPIASIAFIRRNFVGKEQGLPTAIYIGGQNLGPALGTLAGTILMARWGWRAMFAITGLAALAWLPLWLGFAPAGQNAGGAAEPAVDVKGRPAAHSAFWAMSAVTFLASYFWYFVLTWVPAYLTISRGFSTLEMGRVLSIPLFVMAPMNIVAGFVADRLAARLGSVFRVRVLFCAISYLGASALMLLVVAPTPAVMPILVFAMCCTGIGNSNYWAIAQHVPPAGLVGRTIGYLNTVSQLGGVAAPLVTGLILGPRKQFGAALVVAGLCSAAAGLCLLSSGARGLDRLKTAMAE
ncbi:MAG: MFS transporter [Acidobacteria bacterium]|nr:MFS transporter [Acidobacteriota bacterium]